MLWGANEIARENMRSGIAPPECSHPEYHKGADWIDYQIEAYFAGIICPGMPNSVVALGEKFGRLMNYGDGLFGGQFMDACRFSLLIIVIKHQCSWLFPYKIVQSFSV